MADFFFYGTLCHAPLLAAVVGREVAVSPATLEGHAVYWADGRSFPMIVQEAGARAPGVLARGLSAADVARLDYYEGGFAYDARNVMAEAADGAVEARVYFPDTTQLTPGAPWSLADWQAQMGDVAVTAAGPFMRGFGVVPQEAARARYPAMLVTAAARLRAGMAAPTEVRRRASAMDTAVIAQGEAYAQYFSVEDYDLHFRRFDGEMSDPVRRAVWVSGDAATVLPYDPVRDRVVLIEQFRMGSFARGDRQPWMLEPIAGRIDPGETPEAAARREAVEEAGLHLGALWKVGGYYSSPGTMAEYLYAFVGQADLPDDAAGIGGLAVEHEDIRVHVLPFARAMELAASGEIEVGPTLLTLYWLAANRARLRAEMSV